MEDGIARCDALHVGEKAQAHREQIRVRKHNAFGLARSAAGVEEPAWRVGRNANYVRRLIAEPRFVFRTAEWKQRDAARWERRGAILVDQREAHPGVVEN